MIVKWAGGKTDMLGELTPLVLDRLSPGGRYFEPFLGGAAMALSMPPEIPVVASDVCEPLVEMWLAVAKQTHRLAARLAELGSTHSEVQYYEVRASSPDTRLERAARFIYLNKTGFNGLFRVNKAGKFNVPLGRGRASSLPTFGELEAAASRIRSWTLVRSDFELVVEGAAEGDVVFADPPYDGTHDYSSDFGYASQARLAACLRRAARRGVGIVTTNADTPLVRQLYAWADVRETSERRKIAANGDRTPAACVVAVRP